MAMKIAKTADRKKEMDTTKSTDCPKCGKPTRIVKRVKDRERGVPGEFLSPARPANFTRSSSRRYSPFLKKKGPPGSRGCRFLQQQYNAGNPSPC